MIYKVMSFLLFGEAWEEMKLNQPRYLEGINWLAYVGRSPVSRQSVQSYILTYSRLKKDGIFDSPGLPPRGGP